MTTAAKSIRERLIEESAEVRRRAVIEVVDIAQKHPEQAIELVILALGDEDWRVRKEAAFIAAQMASWESVIDRLVDAMVQEENVGLRNAAVKALSASGQNAITKIVSCIPNLNAEGRKMAFEVLGVSSDPRVVGVLVDGLSDPDFNVRASAAEWLGEQGGEEATQTLFSCLTSTDPLIVITALQSLNRIGAPIPWSLLRPLSNQKLYGADLLIAIGRSGAVEAASVIADSLSEDPAAARAMELLHGSSPEAAAAVEAALGKSDDKTRDFLNRSIRDGEPTEQRAAASCLLWLRSISDLPIIIEIAQKESLYFLILDELRKWGPPVLAGLEALMPTLEGKNLASVIGLLTRLLDETIGQDKISLFTKYLESDDHAVVTAAAGLVARFGDQKVIPRLLTLTDSPNDRIRRIAGYALTEVGRRFPDALRDGLATVEIQGQGGVEICRVFEALGRTDDSPSLQAALSSPMPLLRGAALSALAVTAGADALEIIALAMTDEDLSVRMAAATALGKVGQAAAETIVSALHTADRPLKAALIRTLGHVGHPEAEVILHGMCHESAEIALSALEAIHELGIDATALQDEILLHSDREVVKQALLVLGPSVSAIQLMRLLNHPEWDVRLAVVDRLASFKEDREVSEALNDHLSREKDDLVVGAIERVFGIGERRR